MTPPLDQVQPTEAVDPGTSRRLLILELALTYLRHGLPVFLLHGIRADGLCTCGDATCGRNSGKHPLRAGWQQAASVDPAVVRDLLMRASVDVNIGFATGQVVAVDLDLADGEATLEALQAKHEYLPRTVTVRTARGRHLYFRVPDGVVLRNSVKKLGPGFDVRASGGYVCAAGSKHVSGFVYRFEPGLGPDDIAIAIMPQWLIALLVESVVELAPTLPLERPMVEGRAEKWAEAALERECANVRTASPGTRNRTLNTAAFNMGMLVAGGALELDAVRQALMYAAVAAKLPAPEALKTVRSGLAAGMAKDARSAPGRDLPYVNGTAVTHSAVPAVTAADSGGDDHWPELTPLNAGQGAPAFPVSALPDWLATWVEAEATSTQTPADMSAMLGLSVIATCCARKARIRVHGDWFEPLNIYACVVLPPGNRKSAVYREAIGPLNAYTATLAKQMAPEIGRTADAVGVAEKRLGRLIEAASKISEPAELMCKQEDVREARAGLERAKREQVFAPQLHCGDATQEAVARLLQKHDERMALMDAEGCGPFSIMLGRYSKDSAPNVDLYLRAHAGDPYQVDRVSRDPVHLLAPAITMALTVQPEVLRQLGERRELRGLGLLARVLWSIPESTVGRRVIDPPSVPSTVRARYAHSIRELLELPHASDDEPHTITMSAEAWEELRAYSAQLEPQLGPGGELESVADWASKLAGAVARVAALLHAAEHRTAPWETLLGATTVKRAIAIGDYLLAHARVALASMGADPRLAAAEQVLRWLRAHGEASVSRRELHRGMQGRFQRIEELNQPLAVLEERGYVRVRGVPAARGATKQTVHWVDLNPRVLT